MLQRSSLPLVGASLRTLLLAAALAGPAGADDVLVVDDHGGEGVDYTRIYEATEAASDGDTILVREGSYIRFDIVAKSLTVTAEEGAVVFVNGAARIRDLAPTDSVVLRGITAQRISSLEALEISNCEGPIWIEDCSFAGPQLPQAIGNSDATDIDDARRVTFVDCTITGGRGVAGSADAGVGLNAVGSRVFLYDCTLVGGVGAVSGLSPAAAAGEAARIDGGLLTVSGGSLTGGDGGSGGIFGCAEGGDGADGLVLVGETPLAHVLGATLVGGIGGLADGPCNDGADGAPHRIETGRLITRPQGARSLALPGLAAPGETIPVEVAGEPGDVAFLLVSDAQRPRFVRGGLRHRVRIPGGAFLLQGRRTRGVLLGRVGDDGLSTTIDVPAWADCTTLFTQAVVYSRSREVVFASGQAVTVVAP